MICLVHVKIVLQNELLPSWMVDIGLAGTTALVFVVVSSKGIRSSNLSLRPPQANANLQPQADSNYLLLVP